MIDSRIDTPMGTIIDVDSGTGDDTLVIDGSRQAVGRGYVITDASISSDTMFVTHDDLQHQLRSKGRYG